MTKNGFIHLNHGSSFKTRVRGIQPRTYMDYGILFPRFIIQPTRPVKGSELQSDLIQSEGL